jgi:dTMP kinase
MAKGCMIVCDGGNGAGKSTVLQALEAHLLEQGHDLVMTREPGGTPIGEKIRALVLDSINQGMCDIAELMLFEAARAQHVREKILPAIEAGKIVVSDRFDSATFSFQHYARGIPLDLIRQINDIAIDGFRPAMTIILDLDPEAGLQRVLARGSQLDRLEKENLAFLHRARDGYLQQAMADPDHFVVIDAAQCLENVVDEVIATADHVIAHHCQIRLSLR